VHGEPLRGGLGVSPISGRAKGRVPELGVHGGLPPARGVQGVSPCMVRNMKVKTTV
jgi:hypothetical protein